MKPCPDCNSKGSTFGIGCGSKGCKPMVMKCFRCKGSGQITEEMVGWMKEGEKLREARRKSDKGLREYARSIGMKPSDYSAIEQGYVNPLEALNI